MGTPLKCVFDACGGVKENTFKILMGGPMMGNAQYNLDAPIGKATNALLALPATKKNGGTSSVHPLRQVRHGVPDAPGALIMNMYASKNRLEELEAANVFDCIECGSCSTFARPCAPGAQFPYRQTEDQQSARRCQGCRWKLPKRQKPSNRRC